MKLTKEQKIKSLEQQIQNLRNTRYTTDIPLLESQVEQVRRE